MSIKVTASPPAQRQPDFEERKERPASDMARLTALCVARARCQQAMPSPRPLRERCVLRGEEAAAWLRRTYGEKAVHALLARMLH